MKKIVLLIIFPFFSCSDRSESVRQADLKIGAGIFIHDTAYLREILYPTDHNGEPTSYDFYKGKYLRITITNQSDSILYLYARRNNAWPIDSLQGRGIIIDSVYIDKEYVSILKPGVINEDFTTFNDSIMPGANKEKLLLVDIAGEKIKGKIHYGKKNNNGDFAFKDQQFILDISNRQSKKYQNK